MNVKSTCEKINGLETTKSKENQSINNKLKGIILLIPLALAAGWMFNTAPAMITLLGVVFGLAILGIYTLKGINYLINKERVKL